MENSTAPVTPPARTRNVRWVFLGPDGIRAGWSVLLFVAVFLGFVYIANQLAHLVLKQMGTVPPLPGPRLGLLMESTIIVPTVAATAVMAWIERRSIWSYGLSDPLRLRRFATGVFWGFVALSLLIGILVVTGHVKEDGPELHGVLAFRMAIEWFAMFAAVGVAEEMLLRGYLQYTLTRGIGFWWAAIVLAILFGASHGTNPGEDPIGLISAGTAGFVFAYSLYRTGSLFWAIGAHAGWDWGQSYFYGTADSGFNVYGHLFGSQQFGADWLSGGKDGPEGSIFVFIAFAVLIPVIRYTLPRAGAFSGGAQPTTRTPPTGA